MNPTLLLLAVLLHPLPRDVMDRRAQVEVFPDRVEVLYQLGTSDEKVREIFTEMTGEDVSDRAPGELWEEFERRLAPELPQEMTLWINGQETPLVFKSSQPISLHHVRLELLYVAPHEFGTEPESVKFVDNNFAAQPGYHRVAIKSRNETQIVASESPLDVRRVDLIDNRTLNEDERLAMRTVEGTFRVPPPPAWWTQPDAQFMLTWVGSVLGLVFLVGLLRWFVSRRTSAESNAEA
jgi:hypothetical protein